MKNMLSRSPEKTSLNAVASTLGAAALLASATAALAGEILFVSDTTTDSQNIPAVLTADGHNVTVITGDYMVTGGPFGLAEGTNTALKTMDLGNYCSIFWSASGPHEPDGFGDSAAMPPRLPGHGADGGIHNDPAVFTDLSNYVDAGGFVFITGHDAAANPDDPLLAEFIGGTDATLVPPEPAVMGQEIRFPANSPLLGPVQSVPGDVLSMGLLDIIGQTPGTVFPGGVNPVDLVQDLDSVIFPDPEETSIVVAEPRMPDSGSWTVRTPSGLANQGELVNVGHIAYVANGIFLYEDLPSNPGIFLSDGEDDSWQFDPVYKAALLNFAFNSCESLPLDATKTPVAIDQSVSTPQDTPIEITLTGSDPNGDPLTFAIDTGPSNGTLSSPTGASVDYTPNSGHSGPDSFTFRVSDGERTSNAATVTIDVLSNTAPDAADDAYTINEDTPLSVAAPGVLANDSDGDGDSLTVTGHTGPANGSVTVNADGSLLYTPDSDFSGSDSFTYDIGDGNGGSDTATVNITVDPVNDPPDALDDSPTTNEDTSVNIDVLANDSDVDGDALTVTGASNPLNGAVTVNPDNSVIYTPDANFNGSDSFTYTINDGNGGSDTATVVIMINAVNDAPEAFDDLYMTAEDAALNIMVAGVLANDSDVDGDSLIVLSNTSPVHGSVALNADGSFSYLPDLNYNGSDSFSYIAGDGAGGSDTATVTININPINDAPNAVDDAYSTDEDTVLNVTVPDVLANDLDIDGDALTVISNTSPAHGGVTVNANGSFSYTPDLNYHGPDSFDYTASDGAGGNDTATVIITVNPVNDAPEAADDIYSTDEDTTLTVAAPGVLSNDSDVDGDTVLILTFVGPSNGTLGIGGDGSFSYTPNANFHGVDSFTYEVQDFNGGTDGATVTITVNAVNDAPDAGDDAYSTNEDLALSVAAAGVLGNDSDPDGDALTVSPLAGPSNGTLSLGIDGSFTYTPNANFNGADGFSYTANDGNGGTDTAVVTITVLAVNDAPQALDDAYTTNEDVPLVVVAPGTLANDGDIDGDLLSVTPDSGPSNGALTLNGDGSFTYTPNANFSGMDSFSYAANDGMGAFDTATVAITVIGLNDPPTVSASPAAQMVQYSDAVLVTISGDDIDSTSLSIVTTALPAGLSLSSPSCAPGAPPVDCEWTVSGDITEGPGVYSVTVTLTDDGEAGSPALSVETSFEITVEQEDALATYTGPLFLSSAENGDFTVSLMATIRDAMDGHAGDIRNASVHFEDHMGAVLCSASEVTLVFAGDETVGSASCDYSGSLGNAEELPLEVRIVVGNYYIDTSDNEVVVLIVTPGEGKITGGGQLEMDYSAGLYAADPEQSTNYGFNAMAVEKGKKKTQLKGRATIIVRSIDGHKYKIRSNALLTLGVDLDPDGDGNSNDEPFYAEFESKANMTDVTDPLNPISMGGNLLLQLRMTDNGEPGENDTISFTVWDDGTLLFSSNWNGSQSVEQSVARGNLQVH